MRTLLVLLLVGCSGEIVGAAEQVPVSPAELACRWEVLDYWQPPPGDQGVAWVTGAAGLVLYGTEDYCPSFRCLFVPAGEAVIILKDPWAQGGDVYTRSAPTREGLPAECPEESKAVNK